MRTFDFTKLGGYPFSQDDLEFMQQAYTEIATAITATSEPAILSGLSTTLTGTTLTYESGFIALGGEIIRIASGTIDTTNATPAQIKFTTTSVMLDYENGSTYANRFNLTGTIVQDNTGSISLSGLKTLHELRALAGFGEWQQYANSNQAVGTICNVQWRINKHTKTCEVQGWAQHRTSQAGNGTDMPLPVSVTDLLPAPIATSYRSTTLRFSAGWPIVKDANGTALKGDLLRLVVSPSDPNKGFLAIGFSALTGSPDLTKLIHEFNFSYSYL